LENDDIRALKLGWSDFARRRYVPGGGRTHFTGGGSGRGVGHFGNLSHGHYWIYF
jgi:hypothetical protein